MAVRHTLVGVQNERRLCCWGRAQSARWMLVYANEHRTGEGHSTPQRIVQVRTSDFCQYSEFFAWPCWALEEVACRVCGVWRRLLNTLKITHRAAHSHTRRAGTWATLAYLALESVFARTKTVNGAAAADAAASAAASASSAATAIAAAADSLWLLVASLCWPTTCSCCLRFALVIRCARKTRDAAFRCCRGSVASLQQSVPLSLLLVNCSRNRCPCSSCCVCFRSWCPLRIVRELFVDIMCVVRRRVQQMALTG